MVVKVARYVMGGGARADNSDLLSNVVTAGGEFGGVQNLALIFFLLL